MGLVATLFKLYALWLIAGLITLGITVIYVYVTQGYVGTLVELTYDLAFALIPFPVDLLAIWSVNPLSLIFQGMVFVLLLSILLWLRSREAEYCK